MTWVFSKALMDSANFPCLLELVGVVDAKGRWEWNGEGNPTDHRGNTILNVRAMP